MMGIYLNPGNGEFKEMVNKMIYVDKSLLINQVWMYKEKINKYLCVSRPRRFGKSTDANMLVAYYSKGCDSHDIFDYLNISKTDAYLTHLNKHNVIHLNMQDFLSDSSSVDEMLELIKNELIEECSDELEFSHHHPISLPRYLAKLESKKHIQFIFIIDEWDCIFRVYKENKDDQGKYLDFLRNLLKDKSYVECVYMTGILPIKKYGTHSALNMFDEISMLESRPFECFMGFTENEVQALCDRYSIDYHVMKEWYDGYYLTDMISAFSPRSVVASITRGQFSNYWNNTENFEALKYYIDMNFDGLKESVVKMLAGESVEVYVQSFSNDMTSFQTKDDILTLLIHLGYLTYNNDKKTCRIPNKEVADAFIDSIRNSSWEYTTKALLHSKELLEATWEMDEEKVAHFIEQAHMETSIFQYNDENALSYTLYLAYYTARDDYTISKEMPSGKGRADLVFIPRKDKPAMLVELKWNKTSQSAIQQIKEKEYMYGLEHYLDNLLLVGINYDEKTKKHTCIIEKYKAM